MVVHQANTVAALTQTTTVWIAPLVSVKTTMNKRRALNAFPVNSVTQQVLLFVNFARQTRSLEAKEEMPLALLAQWGGCPLKRAVINAKRVEQERLAMLPVKIVKIAWSVNIVQANIQTELVLIQPSALIVKAANSCPIKVPPNAWIVFLDNFKTKKEIKNAKNAQKILLQPVVKRSVRKEIEEKKEEQENISGGGTVYFVWFLVVLYGVVVGWHGGTRLAITPSNFFITALSLTLFIPSLFSLDFAPPACIECPTGKSNLGNSASCGDCVAGKSKNVTTQECVPCMVGTFQSKPNQETCDPCRAGEYQNDKGRR